MKECCIGEDTVEVLRRELKPEKVLMPHLTTAVLPSKLDEALCSLKTDGFMARVSKNFQIPTGAATDIKDSKRSFTLKMFQQRIAILAHIVIARAFPKTIRVLIVVAKSNRRSLRQFLSAEQWSLRCSHAMDKDAGRSAGCDLK